MKTAKFAIWFVCLLLLGTSQAIATSDLVPDPNREALKSLLDELQQKIEEADKRMIAHPKFLEELQSLVDQYKVRLREVFLYDDFSDKDYTENPTWIIKSGKFRITPDNRLRTNVEVIRPSSPAPPQEEDTFGLLLKEIIRSTTADKEDTSASQVQKESAIQALALIAPAFEVDLSFVSESTWGAMEIVLLGRNPLKPRYRLIYKAAASQKRPIEIVRERDSRRYIIESATQYPVLDDGSLHRVQWIRDIQGRMRVLVDGEEVLSTVELFYKDDFGGLQLVNQGGIYEWGPIQILQAPQDIEP
jgi:hypothetical protein